MSSNTYTATEETMINLSSFTKTITNSNHHQSYMSQKLNVLSNGNGGTIESITTGSVYRSSFPVNNNHNCTKAVFFHKKIITS
jgi:hypothetical protein